MQITQSQILNKKQPFFRGIKSLLTGKKKRDLVMLEGKEDLEIFSTSILDTKFPVLRNVTFNPVKLGICPPSIEERLFFSAQKIPFEDCSESELSLVWEKLGIQGVISEGTCGSVYSTSISQRFVIKRTELLNLAVQGSLLERKVESANEMLQCSVECQNLAAHKLRISPRIHYVIRKDRSYFIVMDKIEGENLHNLVQKHNMRFNVKLQIALDIIKKIVGLHELGISHGDLGLKNIMLKKGSLDTAIIDYDFCRKKKGDSSMEYEFRSDIKILAEALYNLFIGSNDTATFSEMGECEPETIVKKILQKGEPAIDEEVPLNIISTVAHLISQLYTIKSDTLIALIMTIKNLEYCLNYLHSYNLLKNKTN